jgi:hypothetical protein
VKERNKEKIRFNTELLRLFFVLLLTTGGGVITLIIEGDSATEMFFIAAGIIVSFVCFAAIYRIHTRTLDLLTDGV